MYGFGYTTLISSMSKGVATPSYPASLKFFIDAGNPLSYPGTGTTVTDLIGTQNGTLINGTGWSSSNGGTFTFDGINDYINFGINTAIQPTAARTVSMWVYVNTGYPLGTFYSDGNLNADRNGVTIWTDSGGYRGEITNSSTYQLFSYNNSTLGSWYYMTVTFNGSTIKTYINSTPKFTSTQSVIPTNEVYPTLLGNANGYNLPLNGKISQVKIYNEARTDAEVTTDFNEFKSRYGY